MTATNADNVTRVESLSRFGDTGAPDVLVTLPGTDHELTTDLDYDVRGNVTQIGVSGVDVMTQTTSFMDFIDQRYPRFVTNAEHHQTTLEYDRRFGTPKAATDPNFRTTLITRDPFGRVTGVSFEDGTFESTLYEDCVSTECTSRNAVLLVTRQVTNGSTQTAPTSRIYLDALGREVLSETQAFSSGDGWLRVESDYDTSGRLARRSLPYSSATGTPSYIEFYNDVRGRVVREVRPDGGITSTTYTASTGTTTVTQVETVEMPGGNSETRRKRVVFDARGLVTSTIDAQGLTGAVDTQYTYDALGNLATVTVDGQQVAAMQYNSAGHRTQIIEVNTGTTTFTTDALGRLRTQTDARNKKTWFDYDSLNRLTTRIDGYQASGAVTHTYYWDAPNAIGDLESKTTNGFSETYIYDDLGRPQRVETSVNVTGFPGNGTYTTTFGYDSASRLNSITYPDHGAFTRHYTSRGYLSQIRQGSTVLEQITQHDQFGRAKRVQFANGLVTQYGHDALGRINRVQTGPSTTPQSIQDIEYQWRSNGMLRQRREGGATETFNSDNLDRVTSAVTSGAASRTLGFSYDDFGNLLNKTSTVAGDLDVVDYDYTSVAGNVHRLLSATIDGIPTSFSYDAAGNIVGYLPSSGDATTLDYDARGQVTAITLGAIASPTAQDQFWYDCDGQRFLKRTSWREGSTTQTGWVLYLLGGAFEQRRIVGDTTLVHSSQVQVTDTVVHRRTLAVGGAVTNSIEYRHRDHLGSVDVVTNASGAVSTNLAFDPFGGRRAADWTKDLPGNELDTLLGLPSSTQRGFTDHEHLDRTGFIHMNGRVYDPRIGRFVQSDPIVQAPFDSQSYNRYSYVFNAPLSYTDPSGFQSVADLVDSEPSLRVIVTFNDISMVNWRTIWGPYPGLESEYPLAGFVAKMSTPAYAPARTEFGQRSAGSTVSGSWANPASWMTGFNDFITSPEVVNFSAGLGDAILFNQGDRIRGWLDIGGGIDYTSDEYTAGTWTGVGVTTLTGGAGGLRLAGTASRGLEFSHWIPARWGGARSLWNGNYVTTIKHALSDPFRYRFMPRTWKALNPLPSTLTQQWNRIPYLWKGLVGGGAYGSVTLLDGEEEE